MSAPQCSHWSWVFAAMQAAAEPASKALLQASPKAKEPQQTPSRSCPAHRVVLMASPKSPTFTSPSPLSMMFSGLMSRCRMPCRWRGRERASEWAGGAGEDHTTACSMQGWQ